MVQKLVTRCDRILDVGAGGFVGETTTVHLLDLFPNAQLTAVERDAGRADALRERFGERIEVFSGDIAHFEPAEPFDLTVVDLDSSAVPLVFDVFLPRVLVPLTRPGGVIVTNIMLDFFNAYYGRRPIATHNEREMSGFLHRHFGALVLTDSRIKASYARHPELMPVVTVEKWRGDRDNIMGWTAFRCHPMPGRWEDLRLLRERGDTEALTAWLGGGRVPPVTKSALEAMIAEGEFVAVDLAGNPETCGENCPAFLTRWTGWCREHFGAAYERGDLREEISALLPWEPDSSQEVVIAPEPLAMLEIPDDMDAYMHEIGAKSRNMVRKAERLGYSYGTFDYNEHLDEVFSINTSKPVRVGGPMLPHYLAPPRPAPDLDLCDAHQSVYFGAFREGVLLGYIQLIVVNQLGIVNQILGHADALPDGVMNGLVHHVVQWSLAGQPVRAVNYLGAQGAETLTRFKSSVGFRPRAGVFRLSHSASLAEPVAPA